MPSVNVCTKERHEVAISDCPAGCKIYACEDGHLMIIHNATYGCVEARHE